MFNMSIVFTFSIIHYTTALLRFFFKKVILFFTFLVLYVSRIFLEKHKANLCDYYALFFCLTLGSFLLISANDFLTMYLGLEIQALSSYILACFNKQTFSTEGSVKYFLVGSFSSSFIVFGMAFLTYLFGTQNFSLFSIYLLVYPIQKNLFFNFLFVTGFFLLCSGLLMKLGVAPFHLWIADIYEASILPVALYFATVQKLVIFIVFVRLVFFSFIKAYFLIQPYILFTAFLSIVFGLHLSIAEFKLKRFLAYSSLNHIGFILVGLSLGKQIIYISFTYFLIYILLAFSVWFQLASKVFKTANSNRGLSIPKTIQDLTALSQNQPFLGFILNINLFSMAGMPPLVGFMAKGLIFSHLIGEVVSYQEGPLVFVLLTYFFLIFVCLLGSLFSTFYYLRLVKNSTVSMETSSTVYISIDYHSSLFLSFFFLINFFGSVFIEELMFVMEKVCSFL